MRPTELELDLGTVTLACTGRELEAALAALLEEARSFARNLRPDEREALRRIMAQDSGTLAVRDVFPGFTRDSEGHRTLRRLRAAMLVRPEGNGCWQPGTRIEVRPFGRLVWDRLGEAGYFPEDAAPPASQTADAAPDATPDPEMAAFLAFADDGEEAVA